MRCSACRRLVRHNIYDVLHLPNGQNVPLKVRSMAGLIPLYAVTTIEPNLLEQLPGFKARLEWFLTHRPDLAGLVSRWQEPGLGKRRLLAICRGHRMKRVLQRMLDETEFLSPYGIRALSRIHAEQPYVLEAGGARCAVEYLPGESNSGLFGGNSNWRGPIWMPVNYLLIESLQKISHYDQTLRSNHDGRKMCNELACARTIEQRTCSCLLTYVNLFCRISTRKPNVMIDQPFGDTLPRSALPTPPKTRGLPLVGSLPALVRRSFDFLLAARARYGDIYTLDLGLFKLVMLNHPRHAEHVLVHNSRNYLRSGATYDAARAFLGNGLATSEGAFWLRQRRMMQPHFHRKRLAALTDLMAATIDAELAAWAPAAHAGDAFNLHPAFNRITMNVIVRALFGTALSHDEIDALSAEMAFAVDKILPSAIASALPNWLPLPGRERLRQVRQTIDTALYEVIGRVRRGGGDATLMAMMLDMVDAETGEQMTDQQLRDEAITLVFAGYETTSLTLSWACDLLTRHPAVLAQLQAEVDTVLGGRPPTFADLPALTYTSMVIQETMRLRPPAWFLNRSAAAADEIDGYAIPAGSIVAMSFYAIHRHPDFWEDPERFDPERFTPERVAGRHKFGWLAFGAGQHQCIGRDFALIEAQLLLAMLVQRYRITGVGRTATPKLTATLQPKDGVWVTLSPTQRCNTSAVPEMIG